MTIWFDNTLPLKCIDNHRYMYSLHVFLFKNTGKFF